jgi:isopenicillin N synthase-like dioxygenase
VDHSVGSLCEGFDIGYEVEGDPLRLPGDQLPAMESDMYGTNTWPDAKSSPRFRSSYLKYFRAMLTLSRKLLKIFALALELPEDYFDNVTTYPGCMSRLIHYPPQPLPDSTHPGIAPHTVRSSPLVPCKD